MSKRFPIYSRILKLYPKAFRQEYGWQMEQTLADMLEDSTSGASKLQIWAQVWFDVPVTIVQQNVSAIKGNSMQKHVPHISKKVAGIIVAVVFVAAGSGLFLLGQDRVAAGTMKIVHGHEMNNVYEEQMGAIGNPVSTLFHSNKSGNARCTSTLHQGLKTRVDCDVHAQAYRLLPTDSAGKQMTLAAVKDIEAKLKAHGYEAGSNGVTLTSLVGGTYEGKDYSPDAFYEKTVGDYHCMYDTTVAYSNPKPAAINMTYSCSRVINIFGAPDLNQPVRQQPPKA